MSKTEGEIALIGVARVLPTNEVDLRKITRFVVGQETIGVNGNLKEPFSILEAQVAILKPGFCWLTVVKLSPSLKAPGCSGGPADSEDQGDDRHTDPGGWEGCLLQHRDKGEGPVRLHPSFHIVLIVQHHPTHHRHKITSSWIRRK